MARGQKEGERAEKLSEGERDEACALSARGADRAAGSLSRWNGKGTRPGILAMKQTVSICARVARLDQYHPRFYVSLFATV